MSTPTFVKYSRVPGRIASALGHIGERVWDPWKIDFRSWARLRVSNEDFDGGLELVGEPQDCESESAALSRGGEGEPFALSYLTRAVPGMLHLYFFDIRKDGFSTTLSFDAGIVYHESPWFERGQFLRGLLTSLVRAFGAEACGYGLDDAYKVKHESLDLPATLARLKTGSLLSIPCPVFHAFSVSRIAEEEIRGLMKSRPTNPRLQYNRSGDYHILSALP